MTAKGFSGDVTPPEPVKILGPHDKTCPNCGHEPLVRGRIAIISEQVARQLDVDPESDEVQRWNAMATTYDGVLCTKCNWDGFAESADPGITVGRFGHRLRFSSFRCSDCDEPFDSLDDLTRHSLESCDQGGQR